MTRDQVGALVAEFLDAEPKWAAVNIDTGGLGLCAEASRELLEWLWRERKVYGVRAWMELVDNHPNSLEPDPRYPRLGAHGFGCCHCVVVVGNYVVDLTARQYDEELPFPFIWEAPCPT